MSLKIGKDFVLEEPIAFVRYVPPKEEVRRTENYYSRFMHKKEECEYWTPAEAEEYEINLWSHGRIRVLKEKPRCYLSSDIIVIGEDAMEDMRRYMEKF